MGLQQSSSNISLTRPVEAGEPLGSPVTVGDAGVPVIVAYAQLPEAGYQANAGWRSAMSSFLEPAQDWFAPVETNAAWRAKALAERAARRAFDGAPPTVPHPMDQTSSQSCLLCHGEGLIVKDRVAAKISHSHYGNCTQCHVPSLETTGPARLASSLMIAANEFKGVFPSGKGSRANEFAPPTIPHPTWMRQDCNSCHGPKGLYGLRTPHPWQQSCTQCHAVSALLDQRVIRQR